MTMPRPQVWADMTASMLRAHELDWRGPLQGASIVPASVAWASQPAGLDFENLAVAGDRTLVDITAPSSTGTTDYLVRCKLTDSAGLIHETEPPIQLRVTPGALVRGGGYTGEVFIGNPVVVVPALPLTLTLFPPTATQPQTPLTVAQSAYFNPDLSTHLTKTFAGPPTDATRLTLSVWFARTASNHRGMVFLEGGVDLNNVSLLRLAIGDIFSFDAGPMEMTHHDGGALTASANAEIRHSTVGAWEHALFRIDTNEVVGTDRIRLYHNGLIINPDVAMTIPALGVAFDFLSDAFVNRIGDGTSILSTVGLFEGYMAEFNVIDGQSLGPGSFGALDQDNVWQPTVYSGTYGTNGFRLTFADDTDYGKDTSGNANDWLGVNFTTAAKADVTPMRMFPQLVKWGNNSTVIVDAGLRHRGGDGGDHAARSTFHMHAGKWYWEAEVTDDAQDFAFGLLEEDAGWWDNGPLGFGIFKNQPRTFMVDKAGDYFDDGVTMGASGLGAFVLNDVFQAAYDAGSGKWWVGKNGTFQGDPVAGTGELLTVQPTIAGFNRFVTAYSTIHATSGGVSTAELTFNFGGYPAGFAQAIPSGFVAMNTVTMPSSDYSTIPEGRTGMDVVEYLGDGVAAGSGGQAIAGLQFQPDIAWVKRMYTGSGDHNLVDSVRGGGLHLSTNLQTAETLIPEGILSIDPAGITVGDDGNFNESGISYGLFAFKKSVPHGIDIVRYAGNGVAGRTIAHALGAMPEFVMVKNLDQTSAWTLYHGHMLLSVISGGRFIHPPRLNPEDFGHDLASTAPSESIVFWNNTRPSSSVVTLGTDVRVNAAGDDYIAYIFRPVPGFSRFGTYFGSGGAAIGLGFTPRWWLQGRSDGAGISWRFVDTERTQANDLRVRSNYKGSFGSTKGWRLDAADNTVQVNDGAVVQPFAVTGVNASATFSFAAFADVPMKHGRSF